MPRQRKKGRPKEPETVYYDIEVEDWEVECNFGINLWPEKFERENYWENSHIIFKGKILSPKLKSAEKAKVTLIADPQKDEHWKHPRRENLPERIGVIEIPRKSDILEINGLIPYRHLHFVASAAAAGKICYVNILGTKLRYRKGDIRSVDL
jgi:hypothetical protein